MCESAVDDTLQNKSSYRNGLKNDVGGGDYHPHSCHHDRAAEQRAVHLAMICSVLHCYITKPIDAVAMPKRRSAVLHF